ncbi:MAG: phosphate/phosphite/phosphonate ABC transporter substrate-binding protein [Rhodoferax sp.]|uniref:phosphate/phosphite/phosphonate ABC transporter substrate-binding protein n=1 Tax=Rhodoferax sp. TaxID=50421 RepID=UPI0026194585|nr:phosphate/phosphite/phosphonate ABC transporter substrate-binding protein [Rhodoferax sp.]MDD2880009.1 phosphate/phosphite/phosphonate ABC transporter substrate-binding protein [Rhodoferax sp.]
MFELLKCPQRPAIRYLLGLAVVCLLGLAGCSREETTPAPQYTNKPAVTDPTTRYIFAVHPLQNPQLLHQKFEPLMAYLETQLPGTSFDLETSSDYADYERKLRVGKSHFSLPNPYHAALSRDWGYHVIAKMGNDELFRGVFIVRKDSPIQTPADLRGKVVAYPAPTALAAAMMPQLYLQKNGINVATDITNKYVGTHNSSIMNAYLHQSDISATWPTAWQAFEKSNPVEAADLKVIWQTPTLIQNAIVARNDVPPEVVAQVKRVLITLQDSAPGQQLLKGIDTTRFVSASDSDFEVVMTFMAEFNRLVKNQK